jgi:hypothetical protein
VGNTAKCPQDGFSHQLDTFSVVARIIEITVVKFDNRCSRIWGISADFNYKLMITFFGDVLESLTAYAERWRNPHPSTSPLMTTDYECAKRITFIIRHYFKSWTFFGERHIILALT